MNKFVIRLLLIGFIFISNLSFAQIKLLPDTSQNKNHAFTIADTLVNKQTSQISILEARYKTALNEARISRQIAVSQNLKQHLALKRKQQLLKHFAVVINKLELGYKKRELENTRKLQASLLQRNSLQAKFDKQVIDQQITQQNQKSKTDSRFQIFLITLLIATLMITSLFYYHQLKMRQLNHVLLVQKQDIENINSTKDHIFSILSNDLRLPINTLTTFNQLLYDDNITAVKLKSYTKEVIKALNNTTALFKNLLNWSRSQMQGYQPVPKVNSLKNLCAEAVNAVEESAALKQITIKNNIPHDVVIYADGDMAQLVIRNILDNAITNTNKGGLVEINLAQSGTKTTFCVTDNGIGMDAMMVNHFNKADFKYSYSSKPGISKEQGSSLGLLLCKKVTHLMNGKIMVISKYGEGCTFSVTLPAGKSKDRY